MRTLRFRLGILLVAMLLASAMGLLPHELGGNTMPENAKRPAMIAFCLAAILLVTYLIAIFVAGDFIIPVALALVGDPPGLAAYASVGLG